MVELSVIAPCFNEQENLEKLVSTVKGVFQNHSIAGELVLVNDGSSDGTEKLMRKLSQDDEAVIGVSHPTNQGITEAWKTGLDSSRGRHVVTIDADMQYPPEDIAALNLQMKDQAYDLVQGWRRNNSDKKVLRKILSVGLSGLLNLLFFKRIHDIKSGFVIYKRDVFLDILEDRKKFLTYQHFFILKALTRGYKFHQVPVSFVPRFHGESFIKNPFLFSLKVLWDLPKALLIYGVLGRFQTKRKK